MPAETEVVPCPACRHLLRVPADWLGTRVQCPECRALFQAPVRDGDRLTDPVLISRPGGTKPTKRIDPMLLLPAFGLMLVGFASVAANVYTLVEIGRDPAGYEQAKKAQAEEWAQKMGQDPRAVGDSPITRWQTLAAIIGWGVLCGTVTFLGGLGIALRRWYRLTQVGCVAAMLNVANCCCVPGAVFGLWGILMLAGEEGRSQFK